MLLLLETTCSYLRLCFAGSARGALRKRRSWREGLPLWRAGSRGRHAGRPPGDLPALIEDHGFTLCPSAAGGPDDPRADALSADALKRPASFEAVAK